MLEDAPSYRPDLVADRWVIETRHGGAPWEVIVEPDHAQETLVVVTAYPSTGEPMKERYLEVTYRQGKPLAAYLYLPRAAGAKSGRTVRAGVGLLVDYSPGGEAIGLEITAPGRVSVDQVNAVLNRLGQPPLAQEELAPLRAV